MSRFSAEIPLESDGYRWDNLGGYGPEDGEELYGESIYLRPVRYDELMRGYRKDDELSFDNFYDPFVKESALFRIFAMLPLTEDAILKFANRYGDITPYDLIVEDGGLTFGNWKNAISHFRERLEKADKLSARWVTRPEQLKHTLAVSEFIDPILAEVPVFMSAGVQNKAIALRANAYNLLDVMQLQLVEALVEQKRYRTCEQCGKPFEVTPQINRSDRIYCSDNCRVKAYQQRRKQAIELRRDGQTLRQIAKELGSDMQTVKKWVQEIEKEK